MGELRQVHVPDIGDFKEVAIIEIAVKPGDRVGVEAPLLTLESDKASMEVPSPAAGVVKAAGLIQQLVRGFAHSGFCRTWTGRSLPLSPFKAKSVER